MTWVEGPFCITMILQTTSVFARKLIPTQFTKPVSTRKNCSRCVKTRGLYIKTGTRHGYVSTQKVPESVLSFPPEPIVVFLLKVYFKKNAKMPQKDVCFQLIEDTTVLCKNGKIIIPTYLRHRAVSWYHHYLQPPGHLSLEETMRSVMYWKDMHTTI